MKVQFQFWAEILHRISQPRRLSLKIWDWENAKARLPEKWCLFRSGKTLNPQWKGSLISLIVLYAVTHNHQTLANRGPDSTFVNKASSTRASPKPRSSQVVKFIDWTLVTWPQGESQVMSTFIFKFGFSFKGTYVNMLWLPRVSAVI